MQRLLAFIENNFHLIIFLLLQAVCAVLLFRLNPYQRAFFSNSTNYITSSVNSTSSNVKNYFGLNQKNQDLQALFADSLSPLTDRYQLHFLGDSMEFRDSTSQLYHLIPAQVIYSSVNKADNLIVINKGSADGIAKGDGLISANGVAGVVIAVNDQFSTAMSMLNTNFKLVPKINGLEFFTEMVWDNQNPYTLKINRINKLEKVEVGDIVTSGNSSLIFPPDIPIGTVQKLESVEGSQYFNTRITTATNFRDLHYVFVVKNRYRNQIEEVLQDD